MALLHGQPHVGDPSASHAPARGGDLLLLRLLLLRLGWQALLLLRDGGGFFFVFFFGSGQLQWAGPCNRLFTP
jgi:hypothetical protein